jgi:hypothetical protein
LQSSGNRAVCDKPTASQFVHGLCEEYEFAWT